MKCKAKDCQRELPEPYIYCSIECGCYDGAISVRMKQECEGYKRYKGIHKPTCSGGAGCVKCWEKYKENHDERN